jgi:phage terminase small subunit
VAKQQELDDFALTNRQALFIAEYLKDFNATKAAIRSGYSRKTARSIGSELLTNPDIDRILKGKLAAKLAEVEASPDRILLELARIAFANPGLKAIEQWTDDELASVIGIEYMLKNVEAGDGHIDKVLKVKRESKLKALELLAKIRGMITDKKIEVEINVNTIEARLNAARARAAERNRKALPAAVTEGEVIR